MAQSDTPRSSGGTTDASLRDDASIARFVREHRPTAWRHARRFTRSDQDADDVVSSAHVKFLRAGRRGRFDRHLNPLAWLLATIRTTAIDQDEAARRAAQVPSTDRTDEPHIPDVIDLTDHEVTAQDLLADLPAGARYAVILVDSMGVSHDDACEILGVSPNALRQRLFRARRAAGIAGASRLAGPPDSPDCDAVAVHLVNDPDDDAVADHLDSCERCQRLQARLADHRSGFRPLYTFPLPAWLPRRARRAAKPAVAGGAVMAAALAAGALFSGADTEPTRDDAAREARESPPPPTVMAETAEPTGEAPESETTPSARRDAGSTGHEDPNNADGPTHEPAPKSTRPAESNPVQPEEPPSPLPRTIEITLDPPGLPPIEVGIGPPTDSPLEITVPPGLG